MHRWQRLVHPSKQFWNWFCGMAFRAAVVLLLMSSMSTKCLPFIIYFFFRNRKKSLVARSGEQARCSNTVICLVAKNSSLLLFFGELLWNHFCTHLPHVKIFSKDFPNCFSVDFQSLCWQPTIFTHNLTKFAMFSSVLHVAGRPDLFVNDTFSSLRKKFHPLINCCFLHSTIPVNLH